ncbi:hypothetical protein ACJMK2_019501 [Sinanodonta woodiana]|uniref:Uncharacterized protein n=1 Tax=Sinanodonta woodiana TaxID=1069815 RepID=A0ABD3TYR0_SINWO
MAEVVSSQNNTGQQIDLTPLNPSTASNPNLERQNVGLTSLEMMEMYKKYAGFNYLNVPLSVSSSSTDDSDNDLEEMVKLELYQDSPLFQRINSQIQIQQQIAKEKQEKQGVEALRKQRNEELPHASLQSEIDSENVNFDSSGERPNKLIKLEPVSPQHGDSRSSPDSSQMKKLTSTTPTLPPCRICGERASGFHYGVNTCEACKGFFRRSLKKMKIDYKCVGKNNDCLIAPGKRNSCPMCRYNKCIAVGMSKDAIKTGRYTHEKRTKDIVEIKKLQDTSNQPEDAETEEELDKIIQMLTKYHREITLGDLPHLANPQNVADLQRKYYEEFQQKKKMFGNLNLSKEEHFSFYRSTGLDIDDRLTMMQVICKSLEKGIAKLVNFAKQIPGFVDLPLEDQASLIKVGRFEVWLLGMSPFINSDLGVICGPLGNKFHIEELGKLYDISFITAVFSFCKNMNKMELTDTEITLLRTIALTFRDRCDLQEPDKVEAIQWRLVKCLCLVLSKKWGSRSGLKFCEFINCLMSARDLTEWHVRVTKNLVIDWPVLQNHPLLLEMMTF